MATKTVKKGQNQKKESAKLTQLEMLYAKMRDAANQYAKAYNEKNSTDKELKGLKKAATAAVDSYNLEFSVETYKEWKEEGNPVEKAVRELFIHNAKRLSFKVDETDYMCVEWSDKDYPVNLPMMVSALGYEVFSRDDWFKACEVFAEAIVRRVDDSIGGTSGFMYFIEEDSKEFKFPKECDPYTDDGAVNCLQYIIDSILYIEDDKNPGTNLIKASGEAWHTIRERMTGDGGLNAVSACNVDKFTRFILEAMNALLTNGSFKTVPDSNTTHKLISILNEK